MLLVNTGTHSIVTLSDDEEEAVQLLVRYFNLAKLSCQDEETGDWILEDGSVVSVCYGEDYLIV